MFLQIQMSDHDRTDSKSFPKHTTSLYGVEGKLVNLSFAERMSAKSLVPTPVEIKKARRFAVRSRASSACTFCAVMKRKCSDTRPCSRCIKQRRTCTDDRTAAETQMVERPIPSIGSIEFVGYSSPAPALELRNDWSFHIILKLWSFGYKPAALANFFNSIPRELCEVTRRALNALQQVSLLQTSLLQKSIQMTPDGLTLRSQEELSQVQTMQLDAAQWEGDSSFGFFQARGPPLPFLPLSSRPLPPRTDT